MIISRLGTHRKMVENSLEVTMMGRSSCWWTEAHD